MVNWKRANIRPQIGIENPCSDISGQMPRMTTAFAQRPAEILLRCRVRAVGRRSMRSHGVHWRCHCVAVEMLVIVLRAPWRSAFFLDAVGSP